MKRAVDPTVAKVIGKRVADLKKELFGKVEKETGDMIEQFEDAQKKDNGT